MCSIFLYWSYRFLLTFSKHSFSLRCSCITCILVHFQLPPILCNLVAC